MIIGKETAQKKIVRERLEILRRLEEWLETPMILLGVVWLILFVIEMIWGLGWFLELLVTGIWIIFIIDFAIKFVLAPNKIEYLKGNWLTAVALIIPALRVFRIVRAFRVLRVARAARGIRLVRLLTSLNRGMKAMGRFFGRRGFGYVLVVSAGVLFGGAAGMFALENRAEGGGFDSYSDALWWTAMMLTTIGSDYFPKTPEGRVLCLLIAIYAFSVFGYITATLATYFVGRDTDERSLKPPRISDLEREIGELRADIRQLLAERREQG